MFIPTIPMVFLANVYSMQQNDQWRSKALSGHNSWTPHLGCGFDHLAFLLMLTVAMDFRVVQWMVGFYLLFLNVFNVLDLVIHYPAMYI